MAVDIESQALLSRIFARLQASRILRLGLGVLLTLALLGIAGRSIYRLVPRHYTLTISGGDIVNNRHFLARLLQTEAPKHNLTLIVEPVSSGLDTLDRLSQGTLDLAFVQGGLTQTYPNVEHVATVMPELVHLLIKPGIGGMNDLKGHSINMGIKNSASRSIALTLLRFAGYVENVDYVETNYAPEQLLALPFRKMPDTIITVSSVPSYLVEILVRKHHYDVKEIPFPESLALRHGWAANGTILAYTYDLAPPVPAKNTQTVSVNMHLLANANVDPSAVAKLLEVMYSPSVENRLPQQIDEKRILVPSGFPISGGTTEYLHRNDSLFTIEMWNKAQGFFGLLMSFAGLALVLIKWFRGQRLDFCDHELHGYLAEVVAIDRKTLAREAGAAVDRGDLERMRERLGNLRILLLERYPKLVLKDPHLFDRCLAAVRASQGQLQARLGDKEISS